MRVFVIRDSRLVAINENSFSDRIDPNDECELYEFSLHTIHELYTNYELRITNREYAHSVAAP